jgi:hypothetical protein
VRKGGSICVQTRSLRKVLDGPPANVKLLSLPCSTPLNRQASSGSRTRWAGNDRGRGLRWWRSSRPARVNNHGLGREACLGARVFLHSLNNRTILRQGSLPRQARRRDFQIYILCALLHPHALWLRAVRTSLRRHIGKGHRVFARSEMSCSRLPHYALPRRVTCYIRKRLPSLANTPA